MILNMHKCVHVSIETDHALCFLGLLPFVFTNTSKLSNFYHNQILKYAMYDTTIILFTMECTQYIHTNYKNKYVFLYNFFFFINCNISKKYTKCSCFNYNKELIVYNNG